MAGVEPGSGRRIAGRYLILGELGRGGMGVVWLAEDELIGRQVALKELRALEGLAADEREIFTRRALTEARNAARIRHPNVVALHDVIPANEQDDAVYLVMELVRARSLEAVIRDDGPLAEERVTAIALQLLDVLDAAHTLGIVHRDVKPANILLADADVVKLADFGIAQSLNDTRLTRTGLVAGTLAYMAPELYRNAPITAAADLWSLGVSLFHAVHGVNPFQRENAAGILSAILYDEVPAPPCGPALARAISALLNRDPARRATSAQVRALFGADGGGGGDGGDSAGDSDAVRVGRGPGATAVLPTVADTDLASVPTAAAGQTPLPRSGRRPRRSVAVVLAGLAALAVVAAALVVGLVLSSGRGSQNPNPLALTSSGAPVPATTDTFVSSLVTDTSSAPAPDTAASPTSAATTDSAGQGSLATGPHYLLNDATSGCLDQDYSGGTPHPDVLSYPCDYDSNESWNVTLNADGSYSLVNAATGECLNQDYSDGYAHDDVIAYPCGANQNQDWQVVETGGVTYLQNEQSGGCLDQDYGDGTPHLDVLAYSPCDYNSNEGWTEQQ